MQHSASTHLWVGPQEYVTQQACKLVQKNYCSKNGCGFCSICKQIETKQFFASTILTTEKSLYSRGDLDTIFSKIALQGSSDQPFFCIITQADKLSASCANSLLKLLEEPPLGWHWILQTDRPQEILPTIVSRCIVKEFDVAGENNTDYRDLFAALTRTSVADIYAFQQLIDRAKISDYESRLLFDEVFSWWVKLAQTQARYFPVTQFLAACVEKQPMPGSGKIFWRTVYLNMYCLLK